MPASEPPLLPVPKSAAQRRLPNRLYILVMIWCCGIFAFQGCCFLSRLLLGPKLINTPAGAEEVAVQITDWTPPANFVGKAGSTMDNWVFRFDVAQFVQKEERGSLIIGQMHYKWFSGIPLHAQIQEQLENLTPNFKKLDVSHSEVRTLTINRAPATFRIEEGEDMSSTTRFRRVVGEFKGKLDSTVLILECEQEFLTVEELDAFLKSIR